MVKLNFRSFYEVSAAWSAEAAAVVFKVLVTDYQFWRAQFVFKFLKDEGQKSLEGGTALVAIGIVLAPKYPLASQASRLINLEPPLNPTC
jgi:hypothetical protein